MNLIYEWKTYYTHASTKEDERFIQLSLDNENRRFILEENLVDIKSTDPSYEYYHSNKGEYISFELFEIIVEGLKNRGYKRLIFS